MPVYSKDVRLPVQLQRAMAAEAEAAREARAKVIKIVRITETSLPYFGVKLSYVCLMFAYRKK